MPLPSETNKKDEQNLIKKILAGGINTEFGSIDSGVYMVKQTRNWVTDSILI